MAKKILALFAVAIILTGGGLGLLWHLGGRVKPAVTDSPTQTPVAITGIPTLVKLPIIDTNQNGNPDWADTLLGAKPKLPNESAVALVNQALAEKETPLLPLEAYSAQSFITYEEGDLNLASGENNETIATYAQSLKAILAAYNEPGLGGEINLVLAVAERGDEAAAAKLATIADRYHTSVQSLLALKAPRSASVLHLNLINTLNRLAEGAAMMAQIEIEPLVALAAAQVQTGRIKPALAAIGNLNIFFAAYNLPDGQAGLTS